MEPKSIRVPLAAWLAAEVALLASVVVLSRQLPDVVATHFDAAGRANGWMPREKHVWLFALLSLGLPGFVVGLTAVIRYFPAKYFNVPNAPYWRSPEHYPEACRILLRLGLWLGAGMCAWTGVLHALIVDANLHSPPRLSAYGMEWFNRAGLVGLVVWILVLIWSYLRPSRDASERAAA